MAITDCSKSARIAWPVTVDDDYCKTSTYVLGGTDLLIIAAAASSLANSQNHITCGFSESLRQVLVQVNNSNVRSDLVCNDITSIAASKSATCLFVFNRKLKKPRCASIKYMPSRRRFLTEVRLSGKS